MGFLNLEGLERFWSHIVAFVGEKIDSLNLKNGTGYKAIKQVGANDATGTNAAAFGNNTKATGHAAMATGYATEANGDYSSASGIMTKANGAYGSVIGKYNETPDNTGYYVAKGTLWTTYENDTTYTRAIGTPTADLTNGKWIYEGTEQVLGSELQVGDVVQPSNYNYTELIGLKETTDTGRTFNWDRYRIENYNTKQSTYAFTVGNGNSNTARSNAHTLDWNGNAWFAGNVSVGENKVPLATENFVIEKDDLVVTLSIDDTGTITSDKTYEEIAMAIEMGRDVFARAIDNGLGYYLPLYVILEEAVIFGLNLGGMTLILGVDSSNTWIQETESISMEPLTFTGAVSATYNGSAPITVEIPESNLQNLVDGTAEGSVRGVTAVAEDNTYTLGKNAFAFGPDSKAEGENSVAIHGWAKNGMAIGVNGGWDSRTLTGEANATTYTYNWGLGDHAVAPGCYLSLDKEKLIKVVSTDNEYLTVEETLSSTPLDSTTVYVWQGVANNGIGIGGQAYDGGISIGGSACGHGAIGVGGGTATNWYSFAQGVYSEAKGQYSSAMGFHAKTFGHASHAEGYSTSASGTGAHAEGSSTSAIGTASHTEGSGTIAAGNYSHVQGQYNIEDTNNKYAHIVGNGEAINERSNAHTLDWSGNAWFAGEVKVGGTSQDDENATTLATQAYVDTTVSNINISSITAARINEICGTNIQFAEEVTY